MDEQTIGFILLFVVAIGYFIVSDYDKNREKQDTLSYSSSQQETIKFQEDYAYYNNTWKWKQLPITYSIIGDDSEPTNGCDSYEIRRLKKAFETITNATNGIITFQKINESADINITCTILENCISTKRDFDWQTGVETTTIEICAHDRGIAQVLVEENTIISGTIEIVGIGTRGSIFIQDDSNLGDFPTQKGVCGGNVNTEIHEILHTLGYGHLDSINSIMNPEEEAIRYDDYGNPKCDNSAKSVDEYVAKDLIRRYSREVSKTRS